MKKITFAALLSALIMLCAPAYAHNSVLKDIELDYERGIIGISGDVGYSNSGSRVTVTITGEDGKTVFSDQTTSTAYGIFDMQIKMNKQFGAQEYTVSVFGTDTNSAAVKTFEFDASRDNYYVDNLRIENSGANQEKAVTGDTLSAKFVFFSSFGYEMEDAEYTWQAAGTADGIYYDLGKSDKECVITDTDIKNMFDAHPADFADKKFYVRVKVKAKTGIAQSYSDEKTSGDSVEITTLPKAENVTAKRDGKNLKGDYSYYDLQGRAQQGSKYEWLVQDGNSYKVVSEGLTFAIPSGAAKNYKFRVTPKCEDGTTGKPVESDAVSAGNTAEVSSGGSGGSGGGGTVSAAKPVVIATPEPIVTPEPQKGFSDLEEGHWAKDAIERLVEKKIISGMGDGSFAPSREVTRAEFAAMMLCCIGAEKSVYDGRFADISDSDWYASVVQTASELGLLNGADGNFRPKDSITREEMAKVLSNVCAKYSAQPQEEQNADFSDNDTISEWAVQDVQLCASLGLISGMPDGSFAPKDCVTRAQAAVVSDKICTMITAWEVAE